jgi:prophage regulatory protein
LKEIVMVPQETHAPTGHSEALHKPQAILRLPAVLFARGLSRSTHYQQIQERLFTKPVNLGARAVGWPSYEVAALNDARIAGKTDDEIRVLVARLEAARKAVA